MNGLDLLKKIEAIHPAIMGVIVSADQKGIAGLPKKYVVVDKLTDLFERIIEATG